MVLSGTYPILTNEDRTRIKFHKYTGKEKSIIHYRFNKKYFNLELSFFGVLVFFIIVALALPQAMYDMSICILFSMVFALGFSIYKKKKIKDQHFTYIYANMICIDLIKDDPELNDMNYYRVLAKNQETDYETIVYVSPQVYSELKENTPFKFDVDIRFLNYTKLIIDDDFKYRMEKAIF